MFERKVDKWIELVMARDAEETQDRTSTRTQGEGVPPLGQWVSARGRVWMCCCDLLGSWKCWGSNGEQIQESERLLLCLQRFYKWEVDCMLFCAQSGVMWSVLISVVMQNNTPKINQTCISCLRKHLSLLTLLKNRINSSKNYKKKYLWSKMKLTFECPVFRSLVKCHYDMCRAISKVRSPQFCWCGQPWEKKESSCCQGHWATQKGYWYKKINSRPHKAFRLLIPESWRIVTLLWTLKMRI